jgi:uncharacterized oxidoreductase
MPTYKPEALQQVGAGIFAAAGATVEDANTVAQRLVEANLAGHDSHGVIRIPQYLKSVEAGDISTGVPVEVTRETAASAVLDGKWGFGQVVASKAIDIGVAKAQQAGVSAITVRHSNHIGRLGSYVEDAASQGVIALLFANAHGAGVSTAPWGGTQPRLSTNPLAVGIPAAPPLLTTPLVLDMTTSAVAEGKIRVKKNRGEPVPDGWILNLQGEPTNIADEFYGPPRGSILPFGGAAGGHKGFGLGVIVDILAGCLSGARTTHSPDARIGNASFFLFIDVKQFTPVDEFEATVCGLISWVKSTPMLPGFDKVLMPGEIEQREIARRRSEGLFIEDETWHQIQECGRKLGVAVEVEEE